MNKVVLAVFALSIILGCLSGAPIVRAQSQPEKRVATEPMPTDVEALSDKLENDPQWIADRDRILEKDVSCQERWDVLWAWSKRGNLEARNGLLFMLTWGDMNRPGSSGDTVSRVRDYSIIAVHALGYKKDGMEDQQRNAISWLNHLRAPSNENFFSCVKEDLSQKCAQIATKEDLIPSFEAYAEEVDMAIAQGKKPVCFRPKYMETGKIEDKNVK